jgi:hypothetical protein
VLAAVTLLYEPQAEDLADVISSVRMFCKAQGERLRPLQEALIREVEAVDVRFKARAALEEEDCAK